MKTFIKLMLLALSMLLLASNPAQALPSLTLHTDSGTVDQGSEFAIALDVADIADLFGYNLTINYDPGKVRFVSVSEGGFLAGAGSTFFIPGVDDGNGTVAFSGAALIGAIGGASGGGNLLNFVFAGRGAGAAMFTLSDLLFIDSALASIEVPGASLGVVVRGRPAEVPEPATLALVLAGFTALAARRGTAGRLRAG